MKRINSLVCTAASILIFGTAVSYAQYGSGRALLAYPMNGQRWSRRTPIAWRAMIGLWLRPDTIPRLCMQPSSTGSRLGLTPRAPHTNTRATQTNRQDSLAPWETPRNTVSNELYYAYLRAGQVCLEARGYQVTR